MNYRTSLLLLITLLGANPAAHAQNLDWLGEYTGELPDIVHATLGPLYVEANPGGGYFMYDYNAYGWLWTDSTTYPWMWVASSVTVGGKTIPVGWIYYDAEASTAGVRLFYQQSNEDWFVSVRHDKTPAPASGFTLVLEQYDNQPISGILIVNQISGSINDNYWAYNSTTKQIESKTPVSGKPVKDYFIKWDSLPDFTGSPSLVSKHQKKDPVTRKYLIVPSEAIPAGRIYVAESPFTHAGWSGWTVNGQQIPAFADSTDRLSGSLIVDKVEFTYQPSNYNTLTLNTTTVDFLSIPMTVEALSSQSATWGSEFGPAGITKTTAEAAKPFADKAWNPFGGVNWSDSVVKDKADVYRILSPFRYMDVHGNPTAWQAFFNDYLTYLDTKYTTAIKYPIQTTGQPSNYFYGEIKKSGSDWNIKVYDRTGGAQSGGDFTVSPATYKDNSYDLFSQQNVTNYLVNDIQSAILRGVAHENDAFGGWILYYTTYFPTTEASPNGSSWTPSLWTDASKYYLKGSADVRFSVYSKLIHEASIVGSRTNETNKPYPASVNKQQFDYGFPTDNIWTHDATATGPDITTATIGIFKR